MRMFTPPSGIPQPVTNLEYKIMKRCTEGKLCKTDLSERDACISQELVNRGIFEKENFLNLSNLSIISTGKKEIKKKYIFHLSGRLHSKLVKILIKN